jgi:predicted nucleic acid-binding protein
MSYLDTNVIIRYCVEADKNHQKAEQLIMTLLRNNVERFYGSPLTLVELYSYISRNIDAFKLPPEFRELLEADEELKVRVHVKECLAKLPRSITFISDTNGLSDVNIGSNIGIIKMFHKFAEALHFYPSLRLTSLDLLHFIYAKQFTKHIKYFATLDKDILKKADIIEKIIGIKIISDIKH